MTSTTTARQLVQLLTLTSTPLMPKYQEIPTRDAKKPGSGNLSAVRLQKIASKESGKTVILKVMENRFPDACFNKQGVLSSFQSR